MPVTLAPADATGITEETIANGTKSITDLAKDLELERLREEISVLKKEKNEKIIIYQTLPHDDMNPIGRGTNQDGVVYSLIDH